MGVLVTAVIPHHWTVFTFDESLVFDDVVDNCLPHSDDYDLQIIAKRVEGNLVDLLDFARQFLSLLQIALGRQVIVGSSSPFKDFGDRQASCRRLTRRGALTPAPWLTLGADP
jgi:hypothetical protein